MPYDIFISYSRRDNEHGRIEQLVARIESDFAAFAGRPLVPFFDASEIHGMDDWRHRILQGLRESRLLLVCLSPGYLQSEYCEWQFNEYLKHEIGRAYFGDGVAPIYFVQMPGWEDKGFEQQCGAWVAELRRRQHFDLRPWFRAGEESLRDDTVRERMRQLNAQLKERITRGERAEHSLGNVDAHNPHFIGRTTELRRLRETVALGKVGVLTAVHRLVHPADLAGALVFRGDDRVRLGRDPLQHQQPDPPLQARPACRGGPVAVRERGAAVLVCAAAPHEPEAELTCPEAPKKYGGGKHNSGINRRTNHSPRSPG